MPSPMDRRRYFGTSDSSLAQLECIRTARVTKEVRLLRRREVALFFWKCAKGRLRLQELEDGPFPTSSRKALAPFAYDP